MSQHNIFINQTDFNKNSFPTLYAEGSELAEQWEDIPTGQQHFCSPNKKPTSDSDPLHSLSFLRANNVLIKELRIVANLRKGTFIDYVCISLYSN